MIYFIVLIVAISFALSQCDEKPDPETNNIRQFATDKEISMARIDALYPEEWDFACINLGLLNSNYLVEKEFDSAFKNEGTTDLINDDDTALLLINKKTKSYRTFIMSGASKISLQVERYVSVTSSCVNRATAVLRKEHAPTQSWTYLVMGRE